jgi:hypothetical protein
MLRACVGSCKPESSSSALTGLLGLQLGRSGTTAEGVVCAGLTDTRREWKP